MESNPSPIPDPTPKPATSWIKRVAGRLRRAVRVVMLALLATLVAYGLIVAVGLVPINNDFRHAEEGIDVLVVSTSIHADFVMPIASDVVDWRNEFPPEAFAGEVSDASHVAIGWGDRRLFIETPTWSDLTAGTLVNALLWPSPTCLHVQMIDEPVQTEGVRALRLSEEQYSRLVDYIRASITRDAAGNSIVVPNASYDTFDAFFEAEGSYHPFRTCNCWVQGGLSAAGVRTGWFTPLPQSVQLWIPDCPVRATPLE